MGGAIYCHATISHFHPKLIQMETTYNVIYGRPNKDMHYIIFIILLGTKRPVMKLKLQNISSEMRRLPTPRPIRVITCGTSIPRGAR